MPRAKLDLPATFPFATTLPVRITDVNYGGHVGNDRLLAMLHEARVRFLASHGLSETDLGGAGLIMTDATVVYRAEAFHGDELRIEVAVVEPRRSGCAFVYRVSKGGPASVVVAEGRTGIAFFDYRERKVRPAPDQFYQRLGVGA